VQVQGYVKVSWKDSHAEAVQQVWNRVHINDLSNLFGLIVQAIIDQKPEIPHGKDGYYFVENGEQSV